MSLPVVIIFERHWDTIPKLLAKDLLPSLARRGYDTLCFEAPQNITSAEIIERHKRGLEFDSNIQLQAERLLKQVGITRELSGVSLRELTDLMRLYVSSKKYLEVAEKIKQLPASRILKDTFREAGKLTMSVKGIDIDDEDFDEMISSNPSTGARALALQAKEDYRIQTMFSNLLKLRAQHEEGIVVACGALHASRLLARFKEQNMQDEVLYYFPHSSGRYENRVDDIRDLVAMNDSLVGHTHLLRKQEVRSFGDRIIKEITEKTRYKREVAGGNSHSQFLSKYFKANFRAFLRPGYHVDALLDFQDSSDIEKIRKRASEVGVQSYDVSLDERRYLVIPNVNTREIANRIRTSFSLA